MHQAGDESTKFIMTWGASRNERFRKVRDNKWFGIYESPLMEWGASYNPCCLGRLTRWLMEHTWEKMHRKWVMFSEEVKRKKKNDYCSMKPVYITIPSFFSLLLLLVALVVSDSVWPHRQQPTRLLCPWDSPGKNTGMGCHFLLQCTHAC